MWDLRTVQVGPSKALYGISLQAHLTGHRRKDPKLGIVGSSRRGSVCLTRQQQAARDLSTMMQRQSDLKFGGEFSGRGMRPKWFGGLRYMCVEDLGHIRSCEVGYPSSVWLHEVQKHVAVPLTSCTVLGLGSEVGSTPGRHTCIS